MKVYLHSLFILLALFLTACISTSSSTPTPSSPVELPTALPSPTETKVSETAVTATPIPVSPIASTETPSELRADILIDSASTFEPVMVQVGQTFAVQPPFAAEWNVDYHQSYLTLLSPADVSHTPDPQSWIFQAESPSESEIRFSSSPSCPENQECPPMAAEFVITVIIEP